MKKWIIYADCELCLKKGIKKQGWDRSFDTMIFLCNEHQKIYDIQQSRKEKINRINDLRK